MPETLPTASPRGLGEQPGLTTARMSWHRKAERLLSVTDLLVLIAAAFAIAVGYGPWRRFWAVDLPLSGPVLLAGLRVTATSTISLVTVGALIVLRIKRGKVSHLPQAA